MSYLDTLSAVQGGLAGLRGGYEEEKDKQTAAARQAALNALKTRELDTDQAARILDPDQAQQAANALGIKWQGPMPVSAMASLTREYGYNHPRPNGNSSVKKFDAAASRMKNEAIAKQHFGLDARLPIPEESQDVVNSYTENLMKADAKAAGVDYQSPTDVARPVPKPGMLQTIWNGITGSGQAAPAAAAPAPAGDGWTVKPK